MKVLILGAGITGVTSAWYLARAGHEVTVVDRQPQAALETSFANGGQVSVSQSEPWAGPEAPFKVAKWLWRGDSPLLFRPRLDVRQWQWGAGFLWECLPTNMRHNIAQMVRLGLYSRDALRELRDETGIAYDCETRGILQIYFDQASLDDAAATSKLMRELGCERRTLNTEEAVQIEPALRYIKDRLAGATFAPDDESGDARLFTQGLADLAAQRGVNFRYNTMILGVEHAADAVTGVRIRDCEGRDSTLRADAYLVCLGSYSPLLVRPLGLYLPIYPTKGYSATIDTEGFDGAPHVSITDDSVKMVFTRLGNRLRIAGTAELNGYNTDLNMLRCEALLRRTFELFPNAGDRHSVQYWTGLRPSTPSNVPMIGGTRYRNLYLNTGHGTLGWTEGCGSAKAIADIISGRKPELDFDFQRSG
ncbi:D-amino acid dehydrogenase [Parachitinimonas caeni]|uniref:D-amino acid dehydrogenase n=1 Tax=Parachitinimonas caeni TaxID=3031301 RepID=A0ABT7E072_9NEIS|nr:D-amino acid dehydrogenase [Parachitinimonas caeni]MDK2125639.1 D-amino acid dehydrogenase [Parachitinimonas caeni]